MKHARVTIPYEFTETIIPPRCRKPRPVRGKATINLTVHHVSTKDAPVAIVEYSSFCPPTSYRWYANRLWTKIFHRHIVSQGDTGNKWSSYRAVSLDEVTHTSVGWTGRSKQEQRKWLMGWARSYIVIKGEVWSAADEPRYVVMTFGLGCNHGGTALMTTCSYNSNIGHSRYYRIDQREEAIAEATRIAEARGDTEDIPIKPYDNFRILLPGVLRLRPSKQHGNGCPFINKVNALTEVKNPLIAAVGAMALLTTA